MTIRKCEYRDILKISDIEKQCFSSPWSYNMLAETFLSGAFTGFVAEVKEICGFGGFVWVSGHADITKVAVLEGFRRQNIGRRLIESIISDCAEKGTFDITLEVRVSNVAAIALYEKAGFKKIAVRKKYYGDEDAFVMQYLFKEQ